MLEQEYHKLLKRIISNGEVKSDRTGVGTISLFGESISGSISHHFPLFGGRKLFFKTAVTELLWYIRGDSDLSFLHKHGCHIWDEWADDAGELGPVYGAQWRMAPTITEYNGILRIDGYNDQLSTLIGNLKNDPNSRRLLINAWNPSQIDDMKLPPCAFMVQFYVRNNKYLDVRVDSRSADVMLGLPHNIAVYSLLTYILAHKCGYIPGRYTHHLGDVHLYSNHTAQANEYLCRTIPVPPTLKILSPSDTNVEEYTHESFTLEGYNPGQAIRMPVAV